MRCCLPGGVRTRLVLGKKKCYVLRKEGDFVLPTMRSAMQTIIADNTHLTERCEAMLAALDGPLAAPLEPTYDELNPPLELPKEHRLSLGPRCISAPKNMSCWPLTSRPSGSTTRHFPSSTRRWRGTSLTASWRRTR